MLLYASRYPQEVAALVLVDPTPPVTDEEGLARLSPEEQAELRSLTPATSGGAGGGDGLELLRWMHRLRPFGVPRLLADGLLEASVYRHLQPAARAAYLARFNNGTFFDALVAESEARPENIAQVRRMAPLGDVPLHVLASSTFTAFYGDPLPATMPPRLVALSQKMLWELEVATSRLAPRGTIERVERSGHYIPIDRPDAVTAAVARTVASLRGA
jgi:pimeloyl-ACP methyl ester carboxylesterase